MTGMNILDAVNGRLLERWPKRSVYINVCPIDYERPSFWLEITRDEREIVTRRLCKRSVQLRLTLHDEADDHYDIHWQRLNDEISECLDLFKGVLAVGTRRITAKLKSMPREADRAVILLDFEFMESAQEPQQDIPAADAYQITVQINGGEIYQRSE